MTPERLVILAGLGSLSLLIGALLFQYVGDMPPCKMCYWQRYPHVLAVLVALLFILTRLEILKPAGLIAALSTAVIGANHAGVEQGWWEGPKSCTSGSIEGLSTDDLLTQIMAAPMVRCDEIPWQLLNISMAGWNMLISVALAGIWLIALRQKST
jgi:disulfide bond formation protein DsbB